MFSYDAYGRVTRTSFPSTLIETYAYDADNNLTSKTDRKTPPAAITRGSFGFGYDALSRRTSLTRPNSVNTTYGYDNLSRLLTVLHQLSGSTIDGTTYTVDNAGNRTSKTDNRTGVASNYGYDAGPSGGGGASPF